MSNLNEEDIAKMLDKEPMLDMENAEITYEVEIKGLIDNLNEWETLIEELSSKEKALLEWKELYQSHSEQIIAETDFKALYGKNNADVRKQHVRKELSSWYDTISDLELSISWINRRISFLRELIRTKRVLMEVKQ